MTKLVNEFYADVFSKVYGFHTIGLRYFNIFGPKQNPNNPYAAVIPIFCQHFIEGTTPTINSDGETSRDFTFVENAVQANVKTMLIGETSQDSSQPSPASLPSLIKHHVFNVACGDQISLNKMVNILREISGQNIQAKYGPERAGDVRHSKASLTKLEEFCGYNPRVRFQEGLGIVYGWYVEKCIYNY